jgi:hypothetical protein
MKRMRLLGPCLVVAAVLSATVVSVASALPEWGRCFAVTPGTGNRANSFCTGPAGAKTFQWVKTLTKSKFVTAGGEAVLSTPGYVGIRCATSTGSGEFKLDASIKKVQKVAVTFHGCEIPAFAVPCQNGAPGDIATKKLTGPIGYIAGQKTAEPIIGQKLTPEKPGKVFAEFVCPAVGISVYIGKAAGVAMSHDAIIGRISSPDAMALTFIDQFSESSPGVQEPQSFQAPFVPGNLETSFGGAAGPFHPSSLTTNSIMTTEEEVEIKAIP